MKKSKSITALKGKKKEKKELKKKGHGISLKGNDKNDYLIVIQDGNLYFDLPVKKEELYELYCLLERRFGEFQGFGIK